MYDTDLSIYLSIYWYIHTNIWTLKGQGHSKAQMDAVEYKANVRKRQKYKNKADIPVILNQIKLNQEDTP